VQADLDDDESVVEPTEFPSVSILHVTRRPGDFQSGQIHRTLAERKLLNPLLWIYNPQFEDYVLTAYATFRVYHATEDYFCGDSAVGYRDEGMKDALRRVIQSVDLVCAVSEDVCQSYRAEVPSQPEFMVLANGCDFSFLQEAVARSGTQQDKLNTRVAIYQGGINPRLDAQLIAGVARRLPDWEFRFAGNVDSRFEADWRRLLEVPNIVYLGALDPAALAKAMIGATVGIIPFAESELMRRSLPLKAFEYAACGLPVVTIPIRALETHPEIFAAASGADEFVRRIGQVAATRYDPAALERRYAEAARSDYDNAFRHLAALLEDRISATANVDPRSLTILLLYDPGAMHISTVVEHVSSFQRFSRHHVHYAAGTRDAMLSVPLSHYDAVVLHYSVRLSLESFLPESVARKIAAYPGLKVLFIQDEYETTETARRWIDRLGIQLLFTCVSPQYARVVYPTDRYPGIKLVNTLTGYAPDETKIARFRVPLHERKMMIGYRGRPLPYWYGHLGHEKIQIGQVMKRICEERAIPCDIDWTHEARIYGDAWYRFLGSCRATLGTESGSNVFDYEGHIRASIEQALAEDPNLTYEAAHLTYIGESEGQVVMNQISPKVFEAIALHTALVLFEGSYSGVVHPDKHFILLKKDFTNIDEVLEKVADADFIARLTQRAYEDIIVSRRFSYEAFVAEFDAHVEEFVRRHRAERTVALALPCPHPRDGSTSLPVEALPLAGMPATLPLTPDQRSQFGDLGLIVRPQPLLSALFRDLQISGHVSLRSPLRFYPGHGLDCVLDPPSPGNYAAALENQRLPHWFEISFQQPVALVQLSLVWESRDNRAVDYTVEIYAHRSLLHRMQVSGNSDQGNVLDVPLCVTDRVHISITRYFGQDRLLMRELKLVAIGNVNAAYKKSRPLLYAASLWRSLIKARSAAR
jgi:glycosyltransferase involved in cell wall biosynthesis